MDHLMDKTHIFHASPPPSIILLYLPHSVSLDLIILLMVPPYIWKIFNLNIDQEIPISNTQKNCRVIFQFFRSNTKAFGGKIFYDVILALHLQDGIQAWVNVSLQKQILRSYNASCPSKHLIRFQIIYSTSLESFWKNWTFHPSAVA